MKNEEQIVQEIESLQEELAKLRSPDIKVDDCFYVKYENKWATTIKLLKVLRVDARYSYTSYWVEQIEIGSTHFRNSETNKYDYDLKELKKITNEDYETISKYFKKRNDDLHKKAEEEFVEEVGRISNI